jgi:hypothetical protein
MELQKHASLTTLHLGGCPEVSSKAVAHVMKKLPGLRSVILPNELSSAIKTLQALNSNARVRPEAPSKYDLLASDGSFSERRVCVMMTLESFFAKLLS